MHPEVSCNYTEVHREENRMLFHPQPQSGERATLHSSVKNASHRQHTSAVGTGGRVARHRTSCRNTSEPMMNAINYFISLNLNEGPYLIYFFKCI